MATAVVGRGTSKRQVRRRDGKGRGGHLQADAGQVRDFFPRSEFTTS